MSEGKQSLQRQADRSKPGSGRSVLSYLVVLFAAAFILLLLAFFMQKRANEVAIDNLEQTSHSAAESLENLIAERDRLKEETAAQEEQIAALEGQLQAKDSVLNQKNADLDAANTKIDALNQLNQIRALYNQRRYSEAREQIAQNSDLESVLEVLSSGLPEEEREIYDPLEAYHDLTDWLS